MNFNHKKAPSFQYKDTNQMTGNTSKHTYKSSKEVNFEEYVRNLDEIVNNKVAQGFQMMISKVVVLIEDQVKARVAHEVQEQLS